jgi:hypothetical protein
VKRKKKVFFIWEKFFEKRQEKSFLKKEKTVSWRQRKPEQCFVRAFAFFSLYFFFSLLFFLFTFFSLYFFFSLLFFFSFAKQKSEAKK